MAAQTSRIEAGELILPNEAPWLAVFEREILGLQPKRRFVSAGVDWRPAVVVANRRGIDRSGTSRH